MENCKLTNGNRENVIDYIKKIKENNKNVKIIDLGAGPGNWSIDYINFVIDKNENLQNSEFLKSKNITPFYFDFNYESGWKDILKYVEENGKFDFSICTHVMEDIACPKVLKEMLCKISKEGYIAFPSKYAEFSNCEDRNYMGYIHHRWIYTIKNNILWGYPKVPFVQNNSHLISIGKLYNNNNKDLSFYWKDNFEFKIVNDDHLGPNRRAVMGYYTDGFTPTGL